MDFYALFKLLHVLAAIAWVGGGATLFALSLFAMMRNDEVEALRVVDSVGVMAMRWFMPAALMTLIFGVIVTFLGNLWGEAWVILGLAGFAATFVTGHFLLRPRAAAISQLRDAGDIDAAVHEGRALLNVSKFDYAMLVVVVALMVLKPTWNDAVMLTVMAVVLVAAGLVFLGKTRRRRSMAAAE